MEYDDIIVGAGSSGAVLAARLSEDPGRNVLLLEAGPDYPDVAHTPTPLLDGYRVPWNNHDWELTAEMIPGRIVPYARGKVIGGSSAVNAVVALRGAPEDFDEWATWGNDQWSWSNVLPFFCRLEDDPDANPAFHGTGGPVPIARWRPEELVPTQRALLDAYRAMGFPVVADHNDPDSTGAGPGPANRRGRLRVSTAIAYLLPARTRSNLTIRADCLVDRIVFDDRRAVGLEIEHGGARERVFGKRTTLSAGAIGSPAILLRSGIGPTKDLRRVGIEPEVESPGVGANLIDHAGVGFSLAAKDGVVDDSTPFWQTILRYTARESAERNDMQVTLFHFVQPAATLLRVYLMRPRSRGTLKLVHRDASHQPEIRLNLVSDPEDPRRLGEGLRLLCELAQTPLLAPFDTRTATLDDGRVLPVDEAVAAVSTTEAIDAYVRQTVSHYVHPVGTARMGPHGDAGAVVDQYCRVRGVGNLRVVDASVMPNIPRANTNLTCIMIGERVADWMRASE